MSEFKRILVGELSENDWLKDAIDDYVKENHSVSDIKINNHFKMRVDIIADALAEMRLANRLERHIVDGISYYRIYKFTDEEFREVSFPTPFGNI